MEESGEVEALRDQVEWLRAARDQWQEAYYGERGKTHELRVDLAVCRQRVIRLCDTIREASGSRRDAWLDGYRTGHHHTVEGAYCDDLDEQRELYGEWLEEVTDADRSR